MDDILFEVLRFAVVIGALLLIRYGLPFFKQLIGAQRLEMITQWVENAVLYAQQTHWDATGAERKEIVIKFLRDIIEKHHIQITDEQLDVLIESAVKAMKLQEGVSTIQIEEYEGEDAEPEDNEGPEDSDLEGDAETQAQDDSAGEV